jgi:hypothetical protein
MRISWEPETLVGGSRLLDAARHEVAPRFPDIDSTSLPVALRDRVAATAAASEWTRARTVDVISQEHDHLDRVVRLGDGTGGFSVPLGRGAARWLHVLTHIEKSARDVISSSLTDTIKKIHETAAAHAWQRFLRHTRGTFSNGGRYRRNLLDKTLDMKSWARWFAKTSLGRVTVGGARARRFLSSASRIGAKAGRFLGPIGLLLGAGSIGDDVSRGRWTRAGLDGASFGLTAALMGVGLMSPAAPFLLAGGLAIAGSELIYDVAPKNVKKWFDDRGTDIKHGVASAAKTLLGGFHKPSFHF